MAARTHINNFTSQLDGGITALAVSIPIDDASGVSAAITAAGSGSYIPMTIDNGTTREIIWVTAATGNTLTAARGQEGTTPAIWPDNTTIECRATAQSIDLNIPIFQISAASGSLTTSLAKVTLGTTDVSLPSAWVATSRHTPLKVGYYYYEAYMEIQNVDVDSNLDIRLLKNAATSIATVVATKPANGGSPPSPTLFSCRASGIVLMNGSTDYMELHARHTGAGSKTIARAMMLGKFLRG